MTAAVNFYRIENLFYTILNYINRLISLLQISLFKLLENINILQASTNA